MVNPATMKQTDNGRAPSDGGSGKSEDSPKVLVPFTRAAWHHHEFAFDTGDKSIGSSSVTVQVEIPPFGFLRYIDLLIELTGGDGSTTAAVTEADAPWSVIEEVQLLDVDSTPIVQLSGYQLYLANKYGAYEWNADPRQRSSFSDLDSDGNGTLVLRVPVEVSRRDGLGALPNLTSEATYKVRITFAPDADVFSTNPAPTVPNVRVKGYAAEWDQPDGTDAHGLPAETRPPGYGSTQQWQRNTHNVESGRQELRLQRIGHSIRTLIYVSRDSNGDRVSSIFPSVISRYFDAQLIEELPIELLRDRMAARYGYFETIDAVNGLDTGVLVYDFTSDKDGHPGNELRDDYLVTSGNSRIELRGEFNGSGSVHVLTNDVILQGGAMKL